MMKKSGKFILYVAAAVSAAFTVHKVTKRKLASFPVIQLFTMDSVGGQHEYNKRI